MSRELKFRAWSLGNKMKGIKPHYVENFSIDAFYGTPKDIFDGNRSEDGIECIEQCTGLKDKNGREIYEGDILHWENSQFSYEGNGVVVYEHGGWCVTKTACTLWACITLYKAEIVGNIHENGDLLNKGKNEV